MEQGNLKSKIIFILFVISLVLLVVNASIDYLKSSNEKIERIPEASIDQLTKLFYDVLSSNGIENDWIKTRRADSSFDSLKVVYNVEIPVEKSILPILKDLNSKIDENTVSLISEEFEINGKTELNLISNKTTKLRAIINHNKDLKILKPSLGFILLEANGFSEDQSNQLLEIPYPFAICIVPSVERKKVLSKITNAGKEFAVLISDDINDAEYLIETGETKKEISDCIGRIVKDFSGASIFLVDEFSGVYKSAVYNFIRDEFVKRKISLKILEKFPLIEAKDDRNLFSIFEFQISQLKDDDEVIFKVKAPDFLALQTEIHKLVKKGYKLVYPSSIAN